MQPCCDEQNKYILGQNLKWTKRIRRKLQCLYFKGTWKFVLTRDEAPETMVSYNLRAFVPNTSRRMKTKYLALSIEFSNWSLSRGPNILLLLLPEVNLGFLEKDLLPPENSSFFARNSAWNIYKLILIWIVNEMTFSWNFFFQGHQKYLITKSRWTNVFQRNLFKTLTLKQYISLVLIPTTHRQLKIYSLTIQLYHVKISAKSNKTRIIIRILYLKCTWQIFFICSMKFSQCTLKNSKINISIAIFLSGV